MNYFGDGQNRRAFLLGSAAAGLSVPLFGCSTTIKTSCAGNTASVLAGTEVQAAWAKPERYFDAHTHFFNARDVHVRGYLAQSIAHTLPEPLEQLAIYLAPIAQTLSQTIALSPADEYRVLCDLRPGDFGALSADNALDKAIDDARAALAESLFKEILKSGPEIPSLVNRAAEGVPRGDLIRLGDVPMRFSQDYLLDALRNGGSLREPSGRLRPSGFGPLAVQTMGAISIKGMFAFVGHMLSPRHHNLRVFIREYAANSPSLPLSGCFAAMVDFNHWLGDPSESSAMRDQVLLHEKLALLSGGFLMPLVGYNPWVDLKIPPLASLNLVRDAIENHGCVGVKIYPPMGFYPYDNKRLPYDSRKPRPAREDLDKRLLALYELCQELEVPVMAHANHSMGRDHGHDPLGGPAGWRSLRDNASSITKLSVNAGHFGGSEVKGEGDWTEGFVKLMSERGSLKVYGDLGHWEDFAGNDASQENLRGLLAQPLQSGGTAADRVMYGSDWFMLSRVPGWQEYGEKMSAAIRRIAPSIPDAENILGGNALRCFGLEPGSKSENMKRLRDFHAKNLPGSKGPGWMTT